MILFQKVFSSLIFATASIVAISAYAQNPPYGTPQVQSVGQTDVFQDIVGGYGSAQAAFATAKQINGILGYSYQVPLTGFTITVGNATQLLDLNPAGTLATGTVTMMPNPGDGQQFALFTSQTQTAITISANTGQTMDAGSIGIAQPTNLAAKTLYRWYYNQALSTWIRIQ